MHASAPQLVVIGLYIFGLVVSANKHGDPAPDYSFWRQLLSTILGALLLAWGGFWN
jgi:hypothetical protein